MSLRKSLAPIRRTFGPVLTGQPRVPWMWVVLLSSLTCGNTFVNSASSAPLTFVIQSVRNDPVIITFLGGINAVFSFIVCPYVSWKSDRIWTRWGRRKPFIAFGWLLTGFSMILIPTTSTFWFLTVLIVLYQFGNDFGYTSTGSALFYETVPVKQRGRATVIRKTMTIVVKLLFSWVLLRQYDEVYHPDISLGPFGRWAPTLTGVQVIFYVTAAMILASLLHLWFNVRETAPDRVAPQNRPPGSPLAFFKDVFSHRQFLLIYVLLFAVVAMTAGLDQLGTLMITDQFHMTKKTLANLQTLSIILNLAVVMPLAALISDKFDRFKIFFAGLAVSTIQPLAFFGFVKFIAPNQIPSMGWIIFFGLTNTLADSVAGLAIEPYFFDLVPRAKMGTMNSGFLLVQGLFRLPVHLGVGIWVKYYSRWAGLPDGQYDYLSGFLYVFVIGLLGCVAATYFYAQRQRGKIIEYGRLESEGKPVPADLPPK